MGRSGGDEHHGGSPAPGDEPEPAELWIDAGSPDQHGGPAGDLTGPAPRSGGAARTRWIALAVGFVVLVAMIAVQHFATGRPTATPDTASSTASSPVSEPSPSPATSDRNNPATSESSAGTVTTESRTYVPLQSVDAELSHAVAEMNSARQAASSAAASTTTKAPDTTSPTTSTVPKQAFPGAGKWELVGYGPAGVVRYRPAAGTVAVTPVPAIASDNVISFVVTSHAAIVRSMDNVEGYLVVDGKPATPLKGLLQKGTRALPGPDASHLWVVTETSPGNDTGTAGIGSLAGPNQGPPHIALTLVDRNGTSAGTTIDIPDAQFVTGGYATIPDGAGYVLVSGVGGTYDARPDGLHLVTHGVVVAVGPPGYLVYDCTDTGQCSTSLIDRKDGSRRPIKDIPMKVWYLGAQGVISPDGSHAALTQFGESGPTILLVDLATGKVHTVDIGDAIVGSGGSALAFSPDGRYLLVGGMSGVTPVDVRTGDLLSPLPIPPVNTLVVRPVPDS